MVQHCTIFKKSHQFIANYTAYRHLYGHQYGHLIVALRSSH